MIAAALLGIAFVVTASAHAHPQLAITELWPGGLDGEESTSDWIEITNVGDTAFDAWPTVQMREDVIPATLPDGIPLAGGVFVGVDVLLPGESAVFLTAYDAEFFDAWSPDAPRVFKPADFDKAAEAFRATWGLGVDDIKLGALNNSNTGQPWEGLSRDGEAVSLYALDGGTNVVTGQVTLLDAAEFPQSDPASWVFEPTPTDQPTPRLGTLSVAGIQGAFTGVNPANGFLLPAVTLGPPPVGSPGVVPEPAATTLLALGLTALTRRQQPRCR